MRLKRKNRGLRAAMMAACKVQWPMKFLTPMKTGTKMIKTNTPNRRMLGKRGLSA